MKSSLLAIALLMCIIVHAQQPQTYKLWPDAPGNEDEIYVYHPAESSMPAPSILICPGGGYEMLAIDHEGHLMAEWFAKQGLVAVVLKYRMPEGNHLIPLSDAEQAISFIRSKAVEWKLDPRRTGVVGSSAGGHLAASLCTLAKDQNRPDFAVLFYPVISFDDRLTHAGSKRNLLGSLLHDKEWVDHYSLDKQIDAKTPPTLIFFSDDDDVVNPLNGINYYCGLKANNIPASLYIFPEGGHGWAFGSSYKYHEEVKRLIAEWLKHSKVIN